MEIRYVLGDATCPQGDGAKIIVHCCNTVGAWGRGFVLALSKRWALPEQVYRAWHVRGVFDVVLNHKGKLISVPMKLKLGEVQVVAVEPDELYVANLIGQEGIRRDWRGRPPVRYEAIRQGLKDVRFYATELEASVHLPRIGAGLAGGRWSEIEAIICDELVAHGISVTVYDLPAAHRR